MLAVHQMLERKNDLLTCLAHARVVYLNFQIMVTFYPHNDKL